MAFRLSPDNSRRAEPEVTAPHFHVWIDTGGLALIAQPPRFGTAQAARQAAKRHGLGKVHVMKCTAPESACRFTVKRERKPRKPCRHCGKAR